MEYQKNNKFLENTSNEPSKLRTKSWVEIDDDKNGVYDKKKLGLKLQC